MCSTFTALKLYAASPPPQLFSSHPKIIWKEQNSTGADEARISSTQGTSAKLIDDAMLSQ